MITMERIPSMLIVVFINYFLNLVTCSDIQAIMTNKIEFKTEAPKDGLSNSKKDCYEYLHGRLSEIRRHGTTWQNGVSDCSNCTCDNGDIRCFFHFCKGPSTGYMTPPSTKLESRNSSNEDEMLVEESSGYPPPGVDDGAYDDEDNKAIASERREDIMSNVIITDVPLEMNEIVLNGDSKGGKWPPKIVPEKWQKEMISSSVPSTLIEIYHSKDKEKKNRSENETHDIFKPYFCGKSCKKVCRRGFKMDPVTGCSQCKCNKCQTICTNKCPTGYVLDDQGCETCACLTEPMSTDGDITFKEDPHDGLDVDHEYINNAISGINTNQFLEENIEFVEDENLEQIPEGTTTSRSAGLARDTFPTPKEIEEEPCNTTEDVSAHDSSATSARSPEEVPQKIQNVENVVFVKPFLGIDSDDQATVKSLAKEDHTTLLVILLTMGILSGLLVFLLMHMWKRYHSDKYAINSYRPEEKQKLRPVKTLHDGHSSSIKQNV